MIKPIGTKIVVIPDEVKETTEKGLYLPQETTERPQQGIVINTGTGDLVRKGDQVIFQKYAGTNLKDGDTEVVILDESDVLAKVCHG